MGEGQGEGENVGASETFGPSSRMEGIQNMVLSKLVMAAAAAAVVFSTACQGAAPTASNARPPAPEAR